MNLAIYDSDIESVKLSIRSRSEAPLKPVWPLAGLLMPWKKLGNLGMFYSLYKTLDSSYDHLKDRRKSLLPKGQAGIKAAKYLLKKLPGYQLRSLIEGSPLERLLSKSGTISTKLLRDYFAANASTVEKDVVAKTLQELFAGLDKVDYNDFKQAVLKSLIGPYTRVPQTEWADYGMDGLGFNLFAPSYQLNTFTFESPRMPYGNTRHYSGNPLGHSRTYTLTEDPHTLYVMESQSDWALQALRKKGSIDAQSSYERASLRAAELLQEIELMKANLEKGLAPDGHRIQHEWERRDIEEIIKATGKQLADNNARAARFDAILHPEKYILENYLKQNYLQRQLQENLRYAAEGGWTKMRYPTPETAAKIEGYLKVERTPSREEVTLFLLKNNPQFKLDTERFSYLRKLNDEGAITPSEYSELGDLVSRRDKAFLLGDKDLTVIDYPPEHQTILKKYADFPKLFLKLFKDQQVRTVTDAKGNTWYEVDVPSNYLLREWPFKNGGILKGLDGNKILDVSKSRINFGKLGRVTHIPGVRSITLDSGYTRDFNVRDIELVLDSLLNHPELGLALRLAILATSLGEAGHKGFDSRGIGGNGMFGISKERMPLSNVGSGLKIGGKQIHWFLNDLQSLHPDNWNHGGEGGLPILNAKDGRDKFYSTDSVKDATIYLNKGYIRPAEREDAWKDRVDTAIYLQKFLNK